MFSLLKIRANSQIFILKLKLKMLNIVVHCNQAKLSTVDKLFKIQISLCFTQSLSTGIENETANIFNLYAIICIILH